MKKFLFFLLFSLFASNVFAQSSSPCVNVELLKSAVINVSTIVTTKIIANTSVSTGVVICNVNLTVAGTATANTLVFEYGSGTLCATGLTVLSGPMLGPVATTLNYVLNLFLPFAKIPVTNDVCLVTTQTGVVSGVVSYINQ